MHSPAIKMDPIDSVFIPGRWRLTNIHGSEFGDLNNYSNILALGIEADKGVNLLLTSKSSSAHCCRQEKFRLRP